MSTFSGLGTALSSLIAQRQALEATGQNIANANTIGYTRQRATMTSVESLNSPTMFSSALAAGDGVRVTGIERLGDLFLDAQLRSKTSTASLLATQATAYSALESVIGEPSDLGIATTLHEFWASWQELSDKAESTAARNVVLENARSLANQIATGYGDIATHWSQTRDTAQTLVTEVNTIAANIADLNDRIRSITVSGGSANELIDQRSVLITGLSALVGAEGRQQADGTMDVMVAGNALVSGVRVNAIELQGSTSLTTLAETAGEADPGVVTGPVRILWAASGIEVGLSGGELAGHLSALSSADNGGILASAAEQYDQLAQTLAAKVNALHTTGYTLHQQTDADGVTTQVQGGEFFTFTAGLPPALALAVAIDDPAAVAASSSADPAAIYDGSLADAIGRIAAEADGPDAQWSAFVVDVGVRSKSAASRADVAEYARQTSQTLQLSQASVDLDEENVNLLAYQRAYEGAARVLTAIDEMLDTLINRTGVVGR